MAGVRDFSAVRPYQREVMQAVLASIVKRRGLSFSVEIARQGGKNELSARLEFLLLAAYCDLEVTSIKAAPTFDPQCRISMDRLWARLEEAGLGRTARREGRNCIRLGRARQLFLSAAPASNVVGHTADLLLEVDEAQNVDPDKFDKELQPMVAATGGTTVFYGTPWDDSTLLERAKQAHLALERRDGVRRHFEYDADVVAAHNPRYRRHLERERTRLGADHPFFLSQYYLRAAPGAGRLLGPTQLALLRGAHPRLDAPLPGETYVAGLDVGGEAGGEGGREHDATVLTLGRLRFPEASPAAEPEVEVVRHYAWSGAAHTSVHAALAALLGEWRPTRLVVDATGIGEPVAAFLARACPAVAVEPWKLTSASKSRLGYGLVTAANAGRLRVYAGAEAAECWRQLERCRAVYRAGERLDFFVDERDGHDDYVVSLALAVEAASGSAPRRARGRRNPDDI